MVQYLQEFQQKPMAVPGNYYWTMESVAAIKALESMAAATKAKTRKDLIQELSEAKALLFAARETEPLMRNALRWVITQVEDSDERNVTELANLVSSSSQSFQSLQASEKSRTA